MVTSIAENTKEDISSLVQEQNRYFKTGKSRDVNFRIKELKKLKKLLEENEEKILDALQKDLKKHPYESLSIEVGPAYAEIKHQIAHVKEWAQPEYVSTSLFHTPGTSKIIREPYGKVLIISPWNYPLLLAINPIAGALAAGNSVILKPSEHSSNVSQVLADIINPNFDKGLLHVVLGGIETSQQLLSHKFDYIFYTGGTEVGRIIYQAAAKNLTPVTLELGGKSPCVIHKDAMINLAAKRIMWGKLINAGQTCLAPDYVFVHESVKDKFINSLTSSIKNAYGEEPLKSDSLAKIINSKQYERLKGYLNNGDIVFGGKFNDDTLQIEPTILMNAPYDSPVMKEEIFGPILPVYTYKNLDDVIQFINERDKPLGAYIFSKSNRIRSEFIEKTSSGGVTENDTVLHISSSHMPFGGVGSSGIGGYHGKFSFDTFSHKRSVLHRMPHLLDPYLRYAPYKKQKFGIMRWMLRKFL